MIETITLPELRERAENGDPLTLAEVLPSAYYASGHIPGAVNLPLDGLDATAARLLPDRAADVVVYCSGPTCKNSHVAAERLASLGYRSVRVFTGGKAAWKDAGLPLTVSP
ncbi:Transcriptional regulator, ArsR family protein [Minicystis rosea]|nr:Transcriptional regulator, ArsR family protein [Minicystis rosea]